MEADSWYSLGLDAVQVFLRMSQNNPIVFDGTEYRDVTRVLVLPGGTFHMQGLTLSTTVSDNRPLSPAGGGRALFVTTGHGGQIRLWQCRISSAEDVISAGPDGGIASISLHSVTLQKAAGSPRDILAVKQDAGWNLGPSFGLVGYGGVTLGAGVSFQRSDGLLYNPKLP